ncbi:MAG TPA: hypothetical protein VHK69_19300, partial [Chitinophagaceae bacterium]|nr:hypothetical protein [Chitinophagaceae bacterium]
KSTDGGTTWTQLNTESSGFPRGRSVGRIGIAVYPKNPQVVYAIVDNNFPRPDTASRKKDTLAYALQDFEKISRDSFSRLDPARLDTFLKRNRLYPRFTARMVMERVSNGTLPPDALYQYLYDANAALFNTPIIGAEVYRSDDGGRSWRKTHTKGLPGLYNTYGYYFGKIYVSPVNPDKIVLPGYDMQLSTDGGKTFVRMDKENVHAYHHAAWINPKRDSHIFSGNDGGLNITYDDGAHWFKANSPAVGQFYAVAVDEARPYNVYGGLQDNGVWWGPSTYKANPAWLETGAYPYKSLLGGDGMQVQVDTRDNATVYSGYQFGNYSRYSRLQPSSGARSITPRRQLGEPALRFNWQTPVWLSRHQQDILYFGANKLFRSFDKGDTMIAISGDLTNGYKAGDVAFGTLTTITESPRRFGLLYTGSDDGKIHVSKDGGSTWTLVSGPVKKGVSLPQGLWVSRVTASAFSEGRVYAALNGYRNDDFRPYLYRSEDYGLTWIAIGTDLPAEPINVVKEDPKHSGILYVGTDGGLYVSLDRGATFMAWNNGLPRSVPVHDIVIQERENEIVVGTHGRSIYIAKLDEIQKAATRNQQP